MKRVTLLFEDESLYRTIEAEAAREGRSVKEVVEEALRDWLRIRAKPSPADRTRELEALQKADEIRDSQPVRWLIDESLAEIREERS